MAKNKQPKVRKTPQAEKIPKRAIDPNIYAQHKACWAFSSMDCGDNFGWDKATYDDLKEIRDVLWNLETMTWNEIFLDAKKQHHSCDVDFKAKKPSSIACKRLKEINMDDQDKLWSIRLSSKKRLWGILDRGVFYILWWDPNHQVYPSTLKRT
ncbi:hypothetical protein [Spirulina subsalsa]|uniref:hypothetical protein n=1 Tax=Spirulina subsalsa TaxID=54311 RepID=UPI0002E734A7|nr:hypothetical protein [Spirulina subsalsa]